MALVVHLNGSNYVSDKTKTAFEKALQHPPVVRRNNGNGNGDGKKKPVAAPISVAPAAPKPAPQPSAPPLGRALEHTFTHQQATMRVHEQYLHNQAEYAQLFSQLMQQQGEIFAQGSRNPQQTQAAVQVITELSHSMARFHELQTQALRVHQQFLEQQAEYGRAYVQLLQQQPVVVSAPAVASPPVAPQAEETWDVAADWDIAEPQSPVVVPETVTPQVVDAPAPAPVAAAPVAVDLKEALLEIVADKTGYPAEMLDLDMDMEADLGIDSIKRVEIMGALQERHPDLPEVEADDLAELRTLGEILAYVSQAAPSGAVSAPAPAAPEPVAAAPVAPAGGDLKAVLLEIVADKTGYPAEMLDLDMDMEADLGIDSIKRVEIMGALQERQPDLPEVEADDLAELRTLGEILAYVSQAPVSEPTAKKA